jgi:hypothetical protein
VLAHIDPTFEPASAFDGNRIRKELALALFGSSRQAGNDGYVDACASGSSAATANITKHP